MFGAFTFQPLPIRLFRQDLESYCPFLDFFLKLILGFSFIQRNNHHLNKNIRNITNSPQVPTFGFQKLASKPNV